MVKHEIDGHPTEFEYDPELGTWHFRVPDLHVVGGGQKNLEEAKRAAAEAIAFTLEDLEGGQVRQALERLGYGQNARPEGDRPAR